MPVSIGDVIAIAQLVYDVGHACYKAPSKINDACGTAKRIRDEMSIQKQVNEKKLSHKAHPKL